MAKKRIGLKTVKMGPIEADGGMSLALTQVGATVSDTAIFEIAESSATEFSIEESDDPFFISNNPGKKTVKFSSFDTDPATCVLFFGGTVTQDNDGNDVWNAPDVVPTIEVSLELTMAKGGVLTVPRASINASLSWAFSKSKLPQLNITGTILTPEKVGEKAFKFNDKTLTAVVAPTIGTQPSGDALASGDNLIVSVVANGTAPFAYQWKKAGVDIVGATSAMYAKAGVVVGDAGSYTCVVSNGKGSVTSNAAVITVSA